MSLFIIENYLFKEADKYSFEKETELQELLFKNPEIIFNVPELEINEMDIAIKYREYMTSRGSIDLLYITKNAEIILVETKLIKNQESTRTVVAQLIDYIKAITIENFENIIEKNCKYKIIDTEIVKDEKFIQLLKRNVNTGNISGIIIGDDIHPNLLELIDSIQSAPHLSFHINLIKLETFKNGEQIIAFAKNVENTKEIERSVIKISFENGINNPIIESETPSKDGKGTKPILTWDEYINNVEPKYHELINEYKREWIKSFGETINMGTVGFSAGFISNNKRIVTSFVYDNKLELITEKTRRKLGVSDEVYLLYKKEIEKSQEIFDKYLISGKVMVYFNDISLESLKTILSATIILTNEFYKENNK
jgi:hypothetical protein